MINILLVVIIDTHFVELSRLARLLSSTGKYHPIFWFNYKYPALERDLEVCRKENWEYIPPTEAIETPIITPKPDSIKKNIKKFVKRYLLRFIPSVILRLLFYRYEIKSQKDFLTQLVSQIKSILNLRDFALLVLSEDNIGYFSNVIIRCGKEAGISTVVLPYTICNASEAAEYFYDNPVYWVNSSFINRFIAKKYPLWIYEHRGRKLFRLIPSTIWALESLGYHCQNPWKLNSDNSATIAVENEHMFSYYKDDGVNVERMVQTGAIYDDVLATNSVNADQKKKKLIEELGMTENLPILLCALPPNQFPRECEFADYASLVKFWMESLAAIQGWNVLIRPHPRQTAAEIAALEKFGLKVTTADTASLVPLCDLYLASVSATIRWAIACGKPVINYDVYRMNYKDYAGVGGVLTMDNRDRYLSTLHKLTQDQVFFAEIQKLQIENSRSWGKLDGKSSERIIQLFDNMIANNSPKA